MAVLVDLVLDLSDECAVGDAFRAPPVGRAAVAGDVGDALDGRAEVGVFGGEREALVTATGTGRRGRFVIKYDDLLMPTF